MDRIVRMRLERISCTTDFPVTPVSGELSPWCLARSMHDIYVTTHCGSPTQSLLLNVFAFLFMIVAHCPFVGKHL